MSVVGSVLTGIAAKVGAPLVKQILERKLGPVGGELAGNVIDMVAEKVGVSVDTLPDQSPDILGAAIQEIEREAPEMLELWSQGLTGQFALLKAEAKQGGWVSAWRWGWMYLLGFFWIWRIVLLPIVNAAFGSNIETIDFAVLLTLTAWFISLYMGGHTVKELGKNAIDAVKTWKRPA